MVYLMAKVVCEILRIPVTGQARDLLYPGARALATMALLVSESLGKQANLLKAYANEPPEALTSLLGNTLFLWINPILAKGYSGELSQDDAPSLDQKLRSKALRQSILGHWEERGIFEMTCRVVTDESNAGF